MTGEITVLFLTIIAVIIAYYFLRTISHLIVNTIIGLIILILANTIFKLGIIYSIPTILVCAFGGIPGAILVILLHMLHVAF